METVFRIFEAGLKEDDDVQSVSPSQLELTRHIAYQLCRSTRSILPSISYVSGSILLEFPALSVAVSEDTTTIIPLSATESSTYFQNTALQEDTRELEKAFLLCFHMATEASH